MSNSAKVNFISKSKTTTRNKTDLSLTFNCCISELRMFVKWVNLQELFFILVSFRWCTLGVHIFTKYLSVLWTHHTSSNGLS